MKGFGALQRVVRRSALGGPARRLYRRLWPLTAAERNARYDHQTSLVMARVLEPRSNCLDIGAHAGAILELITQYSGEGRHAAFEPLPHLAAALRHNFPRTDVFEVALSDVTGTATFEHVVTNPSYSGLRRRRYDRPNEEIRTITVATARLDDLVPADRPIRLVKIDVEGAELQVIRGGVATLTRCQPFVVFEHGLGAADFYGTTPELLYDELVERCRLQLNVMERWLAGGQPLTRSQFVEQCKQDFYFLAHP